MQYIHKKDIINPSYLSRLNKIVGGQNGFPWYFISEDISYDDATDMKFGDTVIRNLTEADVEQVVVKEHGHMPKRDDDPKRKEK